MAGVVQSPVTKQVGEDATATEQEEVDVLAWALEMCPPGEAIEIHTAACTIEPCTCIPRVIVKPSPS